MATGENILLGYGIVSINNIPFEVAYNDLRKKKSVKEMLDFYSVDEIVAELSKNIKEVDIDAKEFLVSLDIEEKDIISDFMILSWMDWVINDITQMNLNLNDNDFKHFAEERNLKEKSEYADRWREKVTQETVNYGLYHTPFDKWAVGDYGV